MRRLGFCASLAVLVSVGACDGFSGDDTRSETPGEQTPAQADAGDASTTPPPVTGDAGDFAMSIAGGQLTVAQGKSVSLEVTITRKPGFQGEVEVVLAEAPGLSAPPRRFAANESKGTLQIAAAADATQGVVVGARLQATSPGLSRSAAVPLDAFVRGAPGAIDTTYGENGVATPTGSGGVGDAAFDSKGRTYVLTSKIERIDADGKVDATFAAPTAPAGFDAVIFLATAGDKLYACGRKLPTTAGIVRFTDTGALDTTFGTNGFAGRTSGFLYNAPQVSGCFASDTVVAAAVHDQDDTANLVDPRIVWRTNTGAPAYNTEGSWTPGELVNAGLFDGVFFGVGEDNQGSPANGVLTKYLTDGKYNTGFGSGGRLLLSGYKPTDMARTTDQKLVLVAPTAMVRYSYTGAKDTAFNAPNTVNYVSGESRVVVQPDGKIVVVHNNVDRTECTIARHEANGPLDTTFGTAGKTVLSGSCDVRRIGLRADGRILLGGKPTRRIWN